MIVSTGNTCEWRTGVDESRTNATRVTWEQYGHSKDRTHLLYPSVLDADWWAIHSGVSGNEIPFFPCSCLLLMCCSQFVCLSGCGQGPRFKARGESHTEEAELGIPCRVVPLGVPLMALKICSESERELLVPPSTAKIWWRGRVQGEKEQIKLTLELYCIVFHVWLIVCIITIRSTEASTKERENEYHEYWIWTKHALVYWQSKMWNNSDLKMFLKEVSYAHQGYIYLIKNLNYFWWIMWHWRLQ